VKEIDVRPSADGTYEVVRDGFEVVGRTASEQEALVLACSERRGRRVWLTDRATGRRVAVDCPVDSPLANFGSKAALKDGSSGD
jgi:hypothetical protein